MLLRLVALCHVVAILQYSGCDARVLPGRASTARGDGSGKGAGVSRAIPTVSVRLSARAPHDTPRLRPADARTPPAGEAARPKR